MLPSSGPVDSRDRLARRVAELGALTTVVVLASWQLTMRSGEDPNGVALEGVTNVVNGTAGDLAQYRVLSAYSANALEQILGSPYPPFEAIRFCQCLLLFGLIYVVYGELGLAHRVRLLGIALITGLASLSLGALAPSGFSMDRFGDAIFYLIAALLVLRGRELWIPPLMVLAVANRETSVFIPTLILARHGINFRDPRVRKALIAAAAAWVVAAVVYFGIHTYYGPRPRTEESYWGTAMLLHSLSMPAQISYLMAAVNLLPVLGWVSLKSTDPFVRRLFWMVVPLWFAIHIWAARMGEGIMYLAPIAVVLVPLTLQALAREASLAPTGGQEEQEARPPVPVDLSPGRTQTRVA